MKGIAEMYSKKNCFSLEEMQQSFNYFLAYSCLEFSKALKLASEQYGMGEFYFCYGPRISKDAYLKILKATW